MFRSQFVGNGLKKASASSIANSKSSRTQSKRVRFGSDSVVSAENSSLAETDVTSSTTSVSSFVRQVKRVLRRRPDDYREFAAAVADVLRATYKPEAQGTGNGQATMVDVIGRIERIILLLDGHPNLIAGLSTILPPGFSVDIQRDAVVVKVYETDGDYSMVDTGHCSVDTGHCRSVEHRGTTYSTTAYRAPSPRMRRPTSGRATSAVITSPNLWEALSSPEFFPRKPRQRAVRSDLPATDRQRSTSIVGGVFSSGAVSNGDARNRPKSSPSRQRRAVTTLSRRPSHLRRTAPTASASVAQPSVSVAVLRQMQSRQLQQQQQKSATKSNSGRRSMTGGAAYIYDVKKALSRHPEVYKKFIGIVKRYHDQRTGGGSSSGATSSQSSGSKRYDDGDDATVTPGDEDDVDDEDGTGPTAVELETIREVVTLLRNRPQLVLAFNDFLPDGYRIRMFDESAYVIEYPCTFAVSGTGGISASIGRLTVAV